MTGGKIALLAIFPILVAAGAAAGQAVFDHPDIDLLDDFNRDVFITRVPVSAGRTCGACHDVDMIAGHGDHARFALDISPEARSGKLNLVAPSSENCAQCHNRSAMSTGIHSAVQMECLDCHFSPDEPAPRGEGSYRPDEITRRCGECHDTGESHEWLPYKKRHMDRVLCETCHIPKAGGRAISVVDWTLPTADGAPRIEYRGAQDGSKSSAGPTAGYRPILLPSKSAGGVLDALAPHNLITSWRWIHGEARTPVSLDDMRMAFFAGEDYRRDILEALDSNGDGTIGGVELVLDTPPKVAAVSGRLEALGLSNPRIAGEVRPYGLHHGVVPLGGATRDCTRCHSESSDASRDFALAAAVPGGVIPSPAGIANAPMEGEVSITNNLLVYTPVTKKSGFYLLGHDRWKPIDTVGAVLVLAAVAAVAVHGGIRFVSWRSRRSLR